MVIKIKEHKKVVIIVLVTVVLLTVSVFAFSSHKSKRRKDQILPIGSVVKVKDIRIPYFIMGRACSGTDGKIYDYAAVMYPAGLDDPKQVEYFDRHDVDSIIYTGYINSDEKKMEDDYEKIREKAIDEHDKYDNDIKKEKNKEDDSSLDDLDLGDSIQNDLN